MAIFVQRNSQKLGPYTLAELRSQLASGALSLKDYVWWTGQTDWIPLVGSPVLAPGFEDPDPAFKKKGDEPTGVSPFSIAALVAGVMVFMAFFTSIPAIIFGICALDDLRKNKRRTGKRMAVIGLALGILSTLFWGGLVGWYYYDYDQIQANKYREEAVNSEPFVPPVPKATASEVTPAPAVNPAPAPAPAADSTPQPASVPGTNAAPATPAP
jgi:hypothetical protein